MLWNNYIFGPYLPPNCDKPPTVYAILEAIVNGDKDYDEDQTKIRDLAKEGRGKIFDFDYPLSETMTREYFECMILNHYMTRRIGFDTVTNFKLHLQVKLNAIMPKYNLLFDNQADIMNTRTITKQGTDNVESNLASTNTNTSNSTTDNRFSDTGQGKLVIDEVKNGDYLTDYTYSQTDANSNGNATSNGTNARAYNEIITENDNDNTYFKIQKEMINVFDMIFKDLDTLFYSIV